MTSQPSITQLPEPKVPNWRVLYQEGAQARCIRSAPPMRGFGRTLKEDDIVAVGSVCWDGCYSIGVREECAFYKLEGYFEPLSRPEEVTP